MSATTKPVSSSANNPLQESSTERLADGSVADWPTMPTETDIYILPDGRVVFADLPVELADLAETLGESDACAVAPISPS